MIQIEKQNWWKELKYYIIADIIVGFIFLYSIFFGLSLPAFGATYATMDSNYCSAGIVLSNGNLTMQDTSGATWDSCFSNVSKSAGKWYWELNSAPLATVQEITGISNTRDTSAPIALAGSNVGGVGYFQQTGQIYYNNTPTACGATLDTGDIVGIALDLDNTQIEVFKNGTSQCVYQIPTTTYYVGLTLLQNAIITYNFGASAFTYSPPNGYEAGLCAESSCSSGGSGTSTPILSLNNQTFDDFINKYYNLIVLTAASLLGFSLIIALTNWFRLIYNKNKPKSLI